jgi:hypothetical protein
MVLLLPPTRKYRPLVTAQLVEKLENGTPVLEEVTLPEPEYTEASQNVIDQMVYSFPSCASCGH